jgi:hypothetical protein|tara:strand:+ start:223 stop:327 length:105 start_codon:yes stop_codon:yes gene_type:complete
MPGWNGPDSQKLVAGNGLKGIYLKQIDGDIGELI